MGYSISIRTNPVKKDRMLAFLGKHYRKWSDVTGVGESISSGNPTDDLSYDSSTKSLGFDYASHCQGWEQAYIYSMTRWMAIRIGQRKTRFKQDTVNPNVFPDPVPFIVYDGFES